MPKISQYRASQRLLNPNQMNSSSPTMEEIKDLQLLPFQKLKLFPPLNSTKLGRKVVAISSRYGFAVIAGSDNRLISVKTNELHALQADDFKELDTFPKRDMDFFNPQAEIFSIEFNSDGRVLAVAANTQNGPFVYVFDGFTFYPSYYQQPFPLQSIGLGENNAAKITSFEWNPCIPEVFATSTTDGLSVYQYTLNNPKSFMVMGAILLNTTCLTWSPEGEQIVIGDTSGSITQLKPKFLQLKRVREIKAPHLFDCLGNPPYKCVGICCLSNTEWAVVHTSPTTNYLHLSLLTAKKNVPPTWESLSDVLPPPSDPSLPRSVTFLPLFDWQFVLATSTRGTNAIALRHNGFAWKPWELPEPLITTHKDTFILGSGYDFTATSPVVIERDGTELPPQPIIYTLTSDGVLLLYHVASLNRDRPSLNKPIEPCDLNGTKNGEQPMGYQPRTKIKQSTTANFSETTTNSPGATSKTQSAVTAQNIAAVKETKRKRQEAVAVEQIREKNLAAEEEQKRKAAAESKARKYLTKKWAPTECARLDFIQEHKDESRIKAKEATDIFSLREIKEKLKNDGWSFTNDKYLQILATAEIQMNNVFLKVLIDIQLLANSIQLTTYSSNKNLNEELSVSLLDELIPTKGGEGQATTRAYETPGGGGGTAAAATTPNESACGSGGETKDTKDAKVRDAKRTDEIQKHAPMDQKRKGYKTLRDSGISYSVSCRIFLLTFAISGIPFW
jgi:hypothetical protein